MTKMKAGGNIISYIKNKHSKRKKSDPYSDAYGKIKWEWGVLPKTKRKQLAIEAGVPSDVAHKMAYKNQDWDDIIYNSQERHYANDVEEYLIKNKIVLKTGGNVTNQSKMKQIELKKLLPKLKKVIAGRKSLSLLENIVIHKGIMYAINYDGINEGIVIIKDNYGFSDGQYKIDKSRLLRVSDVGNVEDFEKLLDNYKLPEKYVIESLKCDNDKLYSAITIATDFIGLDDLRPVMSSVFLKPLGDKDLYAVDVVSTDAHALYKYQFRANDFKYKNVDNSNNGFFLGDKKFTGLYTLVDEGCEIKTSHQISSVKFDKFPIEIRFKLDGKYPNYDAVIPDDYTYEATIPKADLVKAINEVKDLGKILNYTPTETYNKGSIWINEKDKELSIAMLEEVGYSDQKAKYKINNISKISIDDKGGRTNNDNLFLIMPKMLDEAKKSDIAFAPKLIEKVLKVTDGDLKFQYHQSNRAVIIPGPKLKDPKVPEKRKTTPKPAQKTPTEAGEFKTESWLKNQANKIASLEKENKDLKEKVEEYKFLLDLEVKRRNKPKSEEKMKHDYKELEYYYDKFSEQNNFDYVFSVSERKGVPILEVGYNGKRGRPADAERKAMNKAIPEAPKGYEYASKKPLDFAGNPMTYEKIKKWDEELDDRGYTDSEFYGSVYYPLKKKSTAKKPTAKKSTAKKPTAKKPTAKKPSTPGVRKFNAGRKKESIDADKRVQAKPPGRRVSEEGNVYYESRPNRSDVGKNKLEKGGKVKSSGSGFLDIFNF